MVKTFEKDNIKIFVGENAEENWELIDLDENYLWFHLNSFPSCHVIIEHEDPDEELIKYAAQLCKENTKYKNLKDLKICYTFCKNLIKAEKIGSVFYKSKRKVKTIKI